MYAALHPARRGAGRCARARGACRVAMALAALSGDEQRIIFVQLCNPLDPGVAVAFSSASKELWELTQAPRQQLQADFEAATGTAVGRKRLVLCVARLVFLQRTLGSIP